MAVVTGTSTLFFYCYYGSRTTENFNNFPIRFYESKWYELPINQQKYFIIIIANSQIPVIFHGFRLFELSLSTFLLVCFELNNFNMELSVFID